MVKVSKAVSAANAAEVVKAAGKVMRQVGTGAATMAAIAEKASLTHGAIYRHFDNKDELAAAAITADFDKILHLLAGLRQKGGGVRGYIATYLDVGHRDHFEWGCPVASLAAEIHRDAQPVQAAFCAGLRKNIDAVSASMNAAATEDEAIFVLAALSGALAMARACSQADPKLSNAILSAVRNKLQQLVA